MEMSKFHNYLKLNNRVKYEDLLEINLMKASLIVWNQRQLFIKRSDFILHEDCLDLRE